MRFDGLKVGDRFTFDPADNRALSQWRNQVWERVPQGVWRHMGGYLSYRAQRVVPLNDEWDKIWVNSDYLVQLEDAE